MTITCMTITNTTITYTYMTYVTTASTNMTTNTRCFNSMSKH